MPFALARLLAHHARRHWVWIKWVAALGILAWLYSQSRDSLAEIDWTQLRWSYLVLGAGLCTVAFLITFTRWYLLVTAQGLPFRWTDAVRLGFIGILFAYVAPGAVGGDVVKALLIAREHPERKAIAVASVILDRILGLIALFCVGSAASLLFLPWPQHALFRSVMVFLWGGSVLGLFALFLVLHTPFPRSRIVRIFFRMPVVGKALEKIQQGMLLYQERKSIVWGAVVISIVGHFGFLSVFYCASRALNVDDVTPSYAGHLLLIPGAEVAGVMIPTPANVGALEGAVRYVFRLGQEVFAENHDSDDLRRAETAGLMTAIVYRLIHLLISLVGVVFYMTTRKEIEQVIAEEERAEDAAVDPAGNPGQPPTR